MHGGIGMTMEYPIGHYAKRLTVMTRTFDDADSLTAELAELGGLIEPRRPTSAEARPIARFREDPSDRSGSRSAEAARNRAASALFVSAVCVASASIPHKRTACARRPPPRGELISSRAGRTRGGGPRNAS